MIQSQIQSNLGEKESDLNSALEIEMVDLRESLEKKEFTLQLLEQRLFDCELFLRRWGREDPIIREQLVALKINPDLKKKKITNTVEENKILKEQLKKALDEIDDLNNRHQRLLTVQNESTRSTSKEGV